MDGALPPLAVPNHTILADKVYESLREALISRVITPGSRMNLADLSRSLHVSNTPVRQALARLESEGLVMREPYRGYTATPLLDARTIAELYDARALLEPVGAGRAARAASSAQREELTQLCSRDDIARLLDSHDESDVAQRDVDLHVLIGEMSGSTVLANLVGDLVRRATRYTLYHRRSAAEEAWEEHRAVADAIMRHDAPGAAEAMTHHLRSGLERMRHALD